MITVLMIEDEADVIALVREQLQLSIPDIEVHEELNWGNAQAALRRIRPDVVVLDWFDGPGGAGEPTGDQIWSIIWKEWFCPVVVYSAGVVEITDEPPIGHPFIRQVSKGANSEQAVVQHIQEYSPHVQAIRSVQDELSGVTHAVLRDVAKHIFDTEQNDQQRRDMLVRVARRRVAARMDDALLGGGGDLRPWEQYIHPPLISHLVVGDILRVAASDPADPTAYRLVLTPTCDLVLYGQPPKCKVETVLAVKACDPKAFATKGLNLGPTPTEKKLKEKLQSAFNDPHQSGIALLPEYPGVVPLLAIDFRDLEVIPISDIAPNQEAGKRLIRVASIDSPFREFVSWAFLQISCRPGVPPRNMDSVISALIACFNAPAAQEGK